MNLNQHIAACQALVAEDPANGELMVLVGYGDLEGLYEDSSGTYKGLAVPRDSRGKKYTVFADPSFAPNCIVIE